MWKEAPLLPCISSYNIRILTNEKSYVIRSSPSMSFFTGFGLSPLNFSIILIIIDVQHSSASFTVTRFQKNVVVLAV